MIKKLPLLLVIGILSLSMISLLNVNVINTVELEKNSLINCNNDNTSELNSRINIKRSSIDVVDNILLELDKVQLLSFKENKNQLPADIYYYISIGQGAIYFKGSSIVIIKKNESTEILFKNSNNIQPVGLDPYNVCTNYYYGNKQSLSVKHYQKIKYDNLYDDLTLIFIITDNNYLSILKEEGSRSNNGIIELSILNKSVTNELTKEKVITINSSSIANYLSKFFNKEQLLADISHKKDYLAFEERQNQSLINSLKSPPKALTNDNSLLKFLEYSTYLGGEDYDFGQKIAVDSKNNVWVAGVTHSSDFPVVYGNNKTVKPFITNYVDVFIAKINGTDAQLLYSSYLGGVGTEYCRDISIDFQDNVWITGYTYSDDFPVTNDSFQPNLSKGTDTFITKINGTNGQLLYSSYIGGSGFDESVTLNFDNQQNVWLAGTTASSDFPITSNSFQGNLDNSFDFYVIKINNSNGQLLYSSYFGGEGDDYCFDFAIDSSNCIWLVGSTESDDFPITNNSYQLNTSVSSGIVIININCSNYQLLYSSYFGNITRVEHLQIGIDNQDNIWMTGGILFGHIPITNTLSLNIANKFELNFIAKFNGSNGQLLYSSYIENKYIDGGSLIITGQNNVLVTSEVNYNDHFANCNNAYYGVSLTLYDSNGQFLYGIIFGGSRADTLSDIIVDNQSVWLVGYSNSDDFPVTANAYQSNRFFYNDKYSCDVIIAKLTEIDDSDKDGMPNYWENIMKLNIQYNDSYQDIDNDGIPNVIEFQLGLDPNKKDSYIDRDDDGLSDYQEYLLGTRRYDNDTDNDDMVDGWEYIMGLDPNNSSDASTDKDSDGLPNLWEYKMGLNATNSNDALDDMDNDGLTNFEEYKLGSKVNDNDTDNDGMPDGWEYIMGLNIMDPTDNSTDDDNDGLTNLEEYLVGTNIHYNDTDNDGMPDGWEYIMNLNATNSNDAFEDNDGDWVSNLDEYLSGTDPNNIINVPRDKFNIWYFIGISLIISAGGTKLIIDQYKKNNSPVLIKRLIDLFKKT